MATYTIKKGDNLTATGGIKKFSITERRKEL